MDLVHTSKHFQARKGRRATIIACLSLLVMAAACSMEKRSASGINSGPVAGSSPAVASENTPAPQQQAAPGELKAGEAAGSFTAKGETVNLKYAYASTGKRFGSDSIIVLLTDQPIPDDAVAEEIKSQPLMDAGKLRGLEYVFEKEGYWVRFHPSQYQESMGGTIKSYRVESGVVRGEDENTGDSTGGKYSRSVKFAAALRHEQ